VNGGTTATLLIRHVTFSDTGSHTLLTIDPAGNVTTTAGAAGFSGYSNGSRAAARLTAPRYLAVDGAGNVFFRGF
jgi:hypothetical protein